MCCAEQRLRGADSPIHDRPNAALRTRKTPPPARRPLHHNDDSETYSESTAWTFSVMSLLLQSTDHEHVREDITKAQSPRQKQTQRRAQESALASPSCRVHQ